MSWLDEDPERLYRLKGQAQRLLTKGFEQALPRMSDAIYEELRQHLPPIEGVFGALLSSGMSRVNFLELAHALVLEAATLRKAEAHVSNDGERRGAAAVLMPAQKSATPVDQAANGYIQRASDPR